MTRPLWQRYAELSPEAKAGIRQEMMDLVEQLGREYREREKLKPSRPCADDYHDDENDYDKAYHGGWL